MRHPDEHAVYVWGRDFFARLVCLQHAGIYHVEDVSSLSLSCRFGLNGRALILQAAQRAGKKRKASHLAPKDADSAKLHAAEQRDSNSTAPLEQHSPQLAVPAGIDTSARAFQQDTKARADSQGVQPREQKQPTLQSAPRRSEALSTAATDALIDGLDPHDQPLVAYINRSSVPRILRQVTCSSQQCVLGTCMLTHARQPECACIINCRHMASIWTCILGFECLLLAHGKSIIHGLQGVAKRLAGQQLARLLQDAGMAVIPATARSTEAAALRKHAAQAALAQEMSIYRKGIGKQVSFLSDHQLVLSLSMNTNTDAPMGHVSWSTDKSA